MGLIDSDMDDLKYEIEDEGPGGTRIKVIGVGGGGSQCSCPHGAGGLGRRGVLRHEHRRAGAVGMPGSQQAADRRQDDQWPGRRLGSGNRPPGSAGRYRPHHRDAGRRGHGVRHRGPGRRHRHRRGARGGDRSPRNWARSRWRWSPNRSRFEGPRRMRAGRTRPRPSWRPWWIR